MASLVLSFTTCGGIHMCYNPDENPARQFLATEGHKTTGTHPLIAIELPVNDVKMACATVCVLRGAAIEVSRLARRDDTIIP